MTPRRPARAKRAAITDEQRPARERRRMNPNSLANLKPFAKGPDPRRNMKGPPRTHEQLRELIQDMAEELMVGGRPDTRRLEIMLRSMFVSKSAVDHIALLEHGWGKVTQAVTVEDVTNKPDAELIDEFADLIHAARARAGDGDSGGTAPPGAGGGGGEAGA